MTSHLMQIALRALRDVRSLAADPKIGDFLGRVLCVLAPVLAYVGMQGVDNFRLTDQSLADGALHTLWTGHFLHFTFEHFCWDAVMFTALALLLWREERWRLWAWLLLAAPLISVLLFITDPQLSEYRGLSALDSMLYARLCGGLCLEKTRWQRWVFGILPLIGFLGKTIYEHLSGDILFVSDLGTGVVALPLAHLFGFLWGGLWAIWSLRRSNGEQLRSSDLTI